MRQLAAVVVLGVLGALALAGQAARDTPPPAPVAQAPAAPAATTTTPPLLHKSGADHVRPVSPRTLKPIARPIRMPMPMAHGVLSPDGRRAVFAVNDPVESALMVLDVARGQAGRPIDVGDLPLSDLTWLNDHRVVGFAVEADGSDVVEVDAVRRRVVSRERLQAEVLDATRTRDGVVALLAPADEIGRASLLVRRKGRPDRTIRTIGTRAGRVRADERDGGGVATILKPGLAVDPDRGIAYLVDAEADRLAEIDLETGTQRDGPLARASKTMDSRVRYAAWLGDGRLAIAGHHDRPDGSIDPHGLRVVDVSDPRRRQRMLAPRQDFLAAGEGRMVAWEVAGGGVAIFDRRGRREHRLLRGVRVTGAEILGPYAYVHTQTPEGRSWRTHVIELRSGREVGRGRAHVAATASTATARETVLGVSYGRGPHGRLARFDPVTLRREGRGAVVHGRLWDWDRSPAGDRVALGVSSRGRIEIFDAARPGRARRIETGQREGLSVVRWATPNRLIALGGQSHSEALEIDVPSGRVLTRRALGHRYAVARIAGGLAVLVGPQEREGDAELIVIRAGERLRTIALPGVRAAVYSRYLVRPGAPPDLMPGMAVDGDVAYVAPTGAERIVRVNLAGGAVTSHAFRARAAKGGPWQSRALTVLSRHRLLLTGRDVRANGGVARAFTRIVDTRDWTARTLSEDHGDSMGTPAGSVLARYRDGFLTVHDARGRRVARHEPRYGISAVRVHGRYAYVTNGAHRRRNQRTHVIDLRTGRQVRVLPFITIPHLLTLSP